MLPSEHRLGDIDQRSIRASKLLTRYKCKAFKGIDRYGDRDIGGRSCGNPTKLYNLFQTMKEQA